MILIWRVWSVVHRKEVISIHGTSKYKRRPDILRKGLGRAKSVYQKQVS
jgi:hypothetical protein